MRSVYGAIVTNNSGSCSSRSSSRCSCSSSTGSDSSFTVVVRVRVAIPNILPLVVVVSSNNNNNTTATPNTSISRNRKEKKFAPSAGNNNNHNNNQNNNNSESHLILFRIVAVIWSALTASRGKLSCRIITPSRDYLIVVVAIAAGRWLAIFPTLFSVRHCSCQESADKERRGGVIVQGVIRNNCEGLRSQNAMKWFLVDFYHKKISNKQHQQQQQQVWGGAGQKQKEDLIYLMLLSVTSRTTTLHSNSNSRLYLTPRSRCICLRSSIFSPSSIVVSE